jgi:hypothetical protein
MPSKKASPSEVKLSSGTKRAAALKNPRPRAAKRVIVEQTEPPEYGPLDPEEVATRAYFFWLQRGGQNGSAEQDWLRAEQELRVAAGNLGAAG